MIFVTVGAQMPFDRLVRAVDEWAGESGEHVFAQVGESDYTARHIETAPFVSTEEMRRRMREADGIVAHAGMGTILSALELGRPLLVLPRLGHLGETRNDHQVAAATHFSRKGVLLAAFDEAELAAQLDRLLHFEVAERIGGCASEELLERVRSFALGAGA